MRAIMISAFPALCPQPATAGMRAMAAGGIRGTRARSLVAEGRGDQKYRTSARTPCGGGRLHYLSSALRRSMCHVSR
jgi:hypothetical protein